MRLFTAIELSPHVLLRLERLLSALRPEAQINWSPLDNLHITTSFIGNWPETRLDELTDALGSLSPRESFEVKLRRLLLVSERPITARAVHWNRSLRSTPEVRRRYAELPGTTWHRQRKACLHATPYTGAYQAPRAAATTTPEARKHRSF